MKHPRKISFKNADEVKREVLWLRTSPHEQAGNWTLNQICYHLNFALTRTMRAGPFEAVPVTDETKAALKGILAAGEIPSGRKGPEAAMPPAVVPETAIDELLATLEKFTQFRGPFGPHRLFGDMPAEDHVRIQLIHCAHHLGHIVPVGK